MAKKLNRALNSPSKVNFFGSPNKVNLKLPKINF